jgi:hypothetical protein
MDAPKHIFAQRTFRLAHFQFGAQPIQAKPQEMETDTVNASVFRCEQQPFEHAKIERLSRVMQV